MKPFVGQGMREYARGDADKPTAPAPTSLAERLRQGPVVGDGGYAMELEKRGYVQAGPWTPEAVVEHPDAVAQLHREFVRAGADVLQAFTFYASADKLRNRGNYAERAHGAAPINRAACRLARAAAGTGGALAPLVAASVSQTPSYLTGARPEEVKALMRQQACIFVEEGVDLLLAEYFEHLEECCFAVDVLKQSRLERQPTQPTDEAKARSKTLIAASMCIGPEGDMHGNCPGTCAVQLAEQGADLVGVGGHFDPFVSLRTVRLMKEALEAAGYAPDAGRPFLMCQPLGYLTPDAGRQGVIDLPEFPFALEPRQCTRSEAADFARQAHALGVRYIGGGGGFQAYHVRAMGEALVAERGRLPAAADEAGVPLGAQLQMHTKPWVRCRCTPEHWHRMHPATGRPRSAAHSAPDAWDTTAGHELLVQYCEDDATDTRDGRTQAHDNAHDNAHDKAHEAHDNAHEQVAIPHKPMRHSVRAPAHLDKLGDDDHIV